MPIGRRGRPILRTAAVTATATAVNRKVANKMDEKQQEQIQTETPPPAPQNENNIVEELQKLAELHQNGALTDDEFQTAKTKLLENQ